MKEEERRVSLGCVGGLGKGKDIGEKEERGKETNELGTRRAEERREPRR